MKKVVPLFAIGIIGLSLITTTIFLHYRQNLRQHAAGPSCNNTGVTRNKDGSFSFASLHVDANGILVDNSGCEVYLFGINQGGLGEGAGEAASPNELSWWSRYMHYNTAVELINVYWYNQNVEMLDETRLYGNGKKIYFQDWLDMVIAWQKAQGNYVILDIGPQFQDGPCGDDGMHNINTFCPQQSTGSQEFQNANSPQNNPKYSAYCLQGNPPDWDETKCPFSHSIQTYQPTPLQALQSLAQKYKNDPAVLIDAWNEPAKGEAGLTEDVFMNFMNQRIGAIRDTNKGNNQTTPVFIYGRALADIQNGLPNFSYPNLIFNIHFNNSTKNFLQNETNYIASISAARKLGDGYGTDQWGFDSTFPDPTTLIPFFYENKLAVSGYFAAHDLVHTQHQFPVCFHIFGYNIIQLYGSYFGQTGNQAPICPGETTPTPTVSVTMTPVPTISVTPTPTPTITPTGKITPSPTPTGTITLTPTPPITGTNIFLILGFHGVGIGDNVNLNGTGNITTDPSIVPQHPAPNHPQRTVTLTLTDLQNLNPHTVIGQVVFNGGNPVPAGSQGPIYFTGSIDLGNLPSGDYLVKVLTDDYLEKMYPISIHITRNQTAQMPPLALVNGNIVNTGQSYNQIDLLDYNALINCFGQKQQDPSVCANPPTNATPGADINDDGVVDGSDYNLFIRELSVLPGQ